MPHNWRLRTSDIGPMNVLKCIYPKSKGHVSDPSTPVELGEDIVHEWQPYRSLHAARNSAIRLNEYLVRDGLHLDDKFITDEINGFFIGSTGPRWGRFRLLDISCVMSRRGG